MQKGNVLGFAESALIRHTPSEYTNGSCNRKKSRMKVLLLKKDGELSVAGVKTAKQPYFCVSQE